MTTTIGFTYLGAKAWMCRQLQLHGDGYEDSAGELQATNLAEACALHFEQADDEGPLDDSAHWIWDAAVEAIDWWSAQDPEKEPTR